MRFAQLDRILAIEPGRTITGIKSLSLSEEYLQDHFPRFPVMPGVLMLESIFQVGMYLVRATDEFRISMVVLRETRNFKFQGFVQPGDQLVVRAVWHSADQTTVKLKVEGEISGKNAVSGTMVLERFNLADRGLGSQATDAYINFQFRKKYELLFDPLKSGRGQNAETNHQMVAAPSA
ncbi:MAG TPA: 3-hydroxyacyl-ACP dehydratase FabZ family protein [Pirellulaceae bacterium]|nr:3-hydroxyacyl-ACP dehydratase FabZ family protein [Pirellulaceae bacterium]